MQHHLEVGDLEGEPLLAPDRYAEGLPFAGVLDAEVEAGRNLVLKAAWLKDEGREFAQAAAIAKLYTGELARRACNEAVQIHGGYGFMDEYPVSRFYRDAKVLEIGEGTNEIQRLVIARGLGL